MQYKEFTLDPFQEEALKHIQERQSVIVSAPTGAGKTLIVDFAIDEALQHNQRLIYTSPIKALSNQKYRDFCSTYGRENIGILTGDVTINREAPVLIMTTEILRNMLYIDGADSPELQNVMGVVFDEIHYINDPSRGVVWEESLVLLPPTIPIILLSATIPNGEEIQNWLETIKGRKFALIKHHHRPVPLRTYYFDGTLRKYQGTVSFSPKIYKQVKKGRKKRKGKKSEPKPKRDMIHGNSVFSPVEVVSSLDNTYFPAIYFVFSRKACEKAARFVSESRVKLLTRAEEEAIRLHIKEYASDFNAIEELRQIEEELEYVRHGVAFHHAGCVPILKEFVETLFAKGLVKVLFATETFAMGLNLPAKSVLFHALEKFDGESFRIMTPSEFHQMAGRAGRRGIDTFGNAVIVVNLEADEEDIKGLFEGTPDPLESQFRLSYNAICNLLQNREPEEIVTLLKSSFKEYAADRYRKKSNQGLNHQATQLSVEIGKGISCPKGLGPQEAVEAIEQLDVLLRERDTFRKMISVNLKDKKQQDVADKVWKQFLQVGRVVQVKRRSEVMGIVLVQENHYVTMDESSFFPVKVLTEDGRMKRYLPRDLVLSSMIYPSNKLPPTPLPKDYNGHGRLFAEVRRNLELAKEQGIIGSGKPAEQLVLEEFESAGLTIVKQSLETSDLTKVQEELAKHPCYRCEHLRAHRRRLKRLKNLQKKYESLQRRMKESENMSYDAFKRMTSVLEVLGFVDLDGYPTEKGLLLANIHHENDILLAEAIDRGLFRNVKPSELVAFFAIFSLGPKDGGGFEKIPRVRSQNIVHAFKQIRKLENQIHQTEIQQRVPSVHIQRGFSLRMAELSRLWSEGKDLDELIVKTTMSEGTIVNFLRRILNLMQQTRLTLQKMDLPLDLEALDEAIVSLRRSHVLPTLEDEVEEGLEDLADDEKEEDDGTTGFDEEEDDDEDEDYAPVLRLR